jgi:hypothetical protein
MRLQLLLPDAEVATIDSDNHMHPAAEPKRTRAPDRGLRAAAPERRLTFPPPARPAAPATSPVPVL